MCQNLFFVGLSSFSWENFTKQKHGLESSAYQLVAGWGFSIRFSEVFMSESRDKNADRLLSDGKKFESLILGRLSERHACVLSGACSRLLCMCVRARARVCMCACVRVCV